PHGQETSIDGQRVFLAQVGGPQDNRLSDTNLALTKETLDRRLRTRVAVKAGPHDVGVTFLRKNSGLSDEPLQPFTRNLDLQDMNGVPTINFFQTTGRSTAPGAGDPPSRRRISLGHDASTAPASAKASARSRRSSPESEASEGGCARRVLSTVARRAYRRPVTGAEVDELLR